MWQHTCDMYVWRSVWRCKLDCILLKKQLNSGIEHGLL